MKNKFLKAFRALKFRRTLIFSAVFTLLIVSFQNCNPGASSPSEVATTSTANTVAHSCVSTTPTPAPSPALLGWEPLQMSVITSGLTSSAYVSLSGSNNLASCSIDSIGNLTSCTKTPSSLSANPLAALSAQYTLATFAGNTYAYYGDGNVTLHQCSVNLTTAALSNCISVGVGYGVTFQTFGGTTYAYTIAGSNISQCAVDLTTGLLSNCARMTTGIAPSVFSGSKAPIGFATFSGTTYAFLANGDGFTPVSAGIVSESTFTKLYQCPVNATTGLFGSCVAANTGNLPTSWATYQAAFRTIGTSTIVYLPGGEITSFSQTGIYKCSVDSTTGIFSNCVMTGTSTSDINGNPLPTPVCSTYVQLTSPFVVPARDSCNTCYYASISSAVSEEASQTSSNHDTTVLSRDHESGGLSPTHPWIIGSSSTSPGAAGEILFTLQGQRQVVLSSDTAGTQALSVDNFFLFKLGVSGTSTYYGEGTADAVTYVNSTIANDNGYINVNGNPLINYLSTAPGGTASIPVSDFSSELPFNTQIDFKSEALDCGEFEGVSSVYMVFQ
jgi:hypothetical protein